MTEKELVAKMLDTLVKSRKELANIDLGITKKSLPDLDKIIEHISAPLMIMVLGEFSTGKSTFINAMVGEEVAAMNATPTTAVITKLCYGKKDKIIVHFTDGTEKEYKKIAFKRLTSKTGKKNEDKTHEAIEYVERQLPLDILQFVTIIDSPGLNDINEKHSDTTKKFVNNADTVFWMFNALHAGSKTEVDAMESLTPRLKPIAIINMMDEIDEEEDDPQEFLDNLRVQLKDKVQAVVGISAKYALEGKLEKNETKTQIGNLKELEQVVRERVLPNRDKFKLNTLIDELGEWLVAFDFDDIEEINQKNKEIDYEEYLNLKGRIQHSKEISLNVVEEIKEYILVESNKFNEQAMFLLGVLCYHGISFSRNEEKAEQYLESAALKNHTLAQATLGFLYFDKKDIKKAKYWLEKAAKQDEKEALFGMGTLYLMDDEKGEIDFEKGNYNKAIPFLEKAAALNEPNAQYLLFLFYRYGRGVEENQDKASEFLFKAAELEDEEALLALGEAYLTIFEDEELEDSKENLPKAIYCFTKAAEYGNSEAIFNLGEINRKYWNGDDRNEKSLKYYKKAALLGNADAQYWLAQYHRSGIGVTKDVEQALAWFQKSAEQDNAKAQNMLGRCYEEGWGVEKDNIKAIEWFKKAAEQGYAVAQYNLAWYYHNGKAVKQDYKEAFKWFEKAAEQDNANAQDLLGDYYLAGWGVKSSDEQAIYWYKKAAEQGNKHSQMKLGYCFENGCGTEVDIDKAIYWYKKAAEQGDEEAKKKLAELESHDNKSVLNYKNESYFEKCKREAEQGDARAQYELGVCYATGNEVARNDYQAFRWFEQAANKGNAQAQYALANFYAQGRAVTQSTYTAFIWYKKAAAQGYKKAELEIERLQKQKNGNRSDFENKKQNQASTKNQSDGGYFEKCKREAEQGDARAQYELGVCYATGNEVARNDYQAFRWFEQAANKGNAQAQYALANYYAQGRVVTQSTYTALIWYKKAAAQGYKKAELEIERLQNTSDNNSVINNHSNNSFGVRKATYQDKPVSNLHNNSSNAKNDISHDNRFSKVDAESEYQLGYTYAYDKNINYENMQKAFSCFKKAAELGHTDAQYELAKCYDVGFATQVDMFLAASWYKKAAEKGHILAQNCLARCYRNGTGVEKNIDEAFRWYKEAASKGDKNAIKQLEIMNNQVNATKAAQGSGCLIPMIVFICIIGVLMIF